MRRIHSIYRIFVLFLLMTVVSFLIIYIYSTSNMKLSLRRIAKIQMDYSSEQLEQKIREIEIEASSILHGDDLRRFQVAILEDADIYEYVMHIKQMKALFEEKQSNNTGIVQFILYWPDTGRLVSNLITSGISKDLLKHVSDNQWLIFENQVYYMAQYKTKWAQEDDEPFLLIRMEQDWLYRVKNMASGFEKGGTFYRYKETESLFPLKQEERTLLDAICEKNLEVGMSEQVLGGKRYQIVIAEPAKNGLQLITYYPLWSMMQSIYKTTVLLGSLLVLVLVIGILYLVSYNKSILLQINMLVYKLKQVENGNWNTQITEIPNNEFSYIFRQVNQMIRHMEEMFVQTMKEQELRQKAEIEQLQLQIHPHFLYNSLSYIVSVAKEARVREMAVHLSRYYRYCTQKKMVTTIEEELSYAQSYLSIMAMRKTIAYKIIASKEMKKLPIIPLLLQPLIENAVEHGLEERESAHMIQIQVYQLDEYHIRFEVSDDGIGMDETQIEKLLDYIRKKEHTGEGSVGLWNVNQRLCNRYSEKAQLQIEQNSWGGISISFTLELERMKHAGIISGR